MSIFTPEDLILFAYHEASTENTRAIKDAIAGDWALREELQVINSAADMLQTTLESPRAEVVLKVLNYARETLAEETV